MRPLDAHNGQVAAALRAARLVDEATLRAAHAHASATGQDLAQVLVGAGRVAPDALARALAAARAASGSGRFVAAARPTEARPGPADLAPTDPYAPTLVGGGPAGARAEDATATVAPAALPGSAPSAVHGAPGGSGVAAGRAPPGGAGGLEAWLRAPPGPLPPGAALGDYRLERLLARGGMGAVFVAEHRALGRRVALKVLLAGEAAGTTELERFAAEARAAAKLAHPNVVPVYEVGQAAGAHYLTMELVDGPSLRQVVRDEGRLAPRRALALVEQAARGIAAAHAAGVIHRDLKPHNVLVAPGDVAKVMDFGLAKDAGDTARQGLTVSGALLGTPSYMAPEQAAGEAVGPLADVYGLGAVLYECLVGRPPFEGATVANLLTQVLTREPERPRALRPELHPDVETICLKALEKDPARRYASAEALAEDARRWVAGEAIAARPAGPVERAARWARRRRGVVAAGGLGLAAVSAVLAWFLVVAARLDARAAATFEQRAVAATDALAAGLAGPGLAGADEPEALARGVAAVRAHVAAVGSEAQALAPGARARVARGWPVDEAGLLARAFEVHVGAVRGALEGALAAAPDDEAAIGAVVGQVAARRADLARALEVRLPAEARARVGAPWPLDGGALVAARWLALASRRAEAGAPEQEVARAWARAYAAAPAALPGRVGLFELASRRLRARDRAVAARLAPRAPSAPLARALLRRALRLALERLEVEPARDALAALGSDGPGDDLAGARALLDALRGEVALVGASAHASRVVGEGPARLATLGVDGRGALHAWSPGAGRLVATPLCPDGVPALGQEAVSNVAVGALPGRPDEVVLALFTDGRRLLVVDARGRALEGGVLPRGGRPASNAALRFYPREDGRLGLACGLGPNQGDGLLAVVEAGALREVRELDPEGGHRPLGRPTMRSYVDVVAHGRFGPGGARRLALAYGAWMGYDLRALDPDSGALAGASQALATIRRLEAVDVDGDGRDELLAGVHWGEGREPGHLPVGVALLRLEPDRAEVLARHDASGDLAALGPAPSPWATGVTALTVLRRGRGLAPLVVAPTFGFAGPRRAGVLRVLAAAPAALAPVLALDVGGVHAWSPVAGLDLDDDGDDELVVGDDGRLRALGLAALAPADQAAAPRPEGPALDPDAEAVDLLGRLGFGPLAAEVVARREADEGVSAASEAVALALWAREAAATPPEGPRHEALVDGLSTFAEQPGRSAEAAAQARGLAAVALARREGPARTARARAAADAALPWLEGDLRARVEGASVVLEARDPARCPPLEVDFVALAGGDAASDPRARDLATHLLSDDPARARLEPGRGLVLRANRRVRAAAGVPVELPRGAVRLELDLGWEGMAWQTVVEVGLVREIGRVQGRPRPLLEGLTVGVARWQPAMDLRTARHGLAPGFGRPTQEFDPGDLQLDEHTPSSVGWPLLHRGRLRVVLEHDPSTRWGRVVVVDRAREVVLRDTDGVSLQALTGGAYLLGLVSSAFQCDDLTGGNLTPDAAVWLERARVAVRPAQGRGAARLAPPSGLVGPLGPLTAGGVTLALDARAPGQADPAGATGAPATAGAAAVDRAYARAAAAAAPAERARLLLHRVVACARAGDGDRARAAAAELARAPALSLQRALEDDARLLEPSARAAVAEALRDALAGEADPRRRAVLHLWRGERAEATAALEALGARLAAGEDAPDVDGASAAAIVAWLRLALSLPGASEEAVRSTRPPDALVQPELFQFRPVLWAPPPGLEGAALEAALEAHVQAASAGFGRPGGVEALLVALDRQAAWARDPRPALLRRAQAARRITSLGWLVREDLGRLAALDPRGAQARHDLGVTLVQWFDPEAAGAELRAAAALGLDLGPTLRALEPFFERASVPPERRQAFARALVGDDRAWGEFVRRLPDEPWLAAPGP